MESQIDQMIAERIKSSDSIVQAERKIGERPVMVGLKPVVFGAKRHAGIKNIQTANMRVIYDIAAVIENKRGAQNV